MRDGQMSPTGFQKLYSLDKNNKNQNWLHILRIEQHLELSYYAGM
jgi:hypothetical protein